MTQTCNTTRTHGPATAISYLYMGQQTPHCCQNGLYETSSDILQTMNRPSLHPPCTLWPVLTTTLKTVYIRLIKFNGTMISVFPKPIQKFPTHMKCLLSLLQCTFYVLNIMRTVFYKTCCNCCSNLMTVLHQTTNKSVFSLIPQLSTWHCLHLLLSAAACYWSISPARGALSSKSAAHHCCCWSMRQMNRGMLDCFINPAPSITIEATDNWIIKSLTF